MNIPRLITAVFFIFHLKRKRSVHELIPKIRFVCIPRKITRLLRRSHSTKVYSAESGGIIDRQLLEQIALLSRLKEMYACKLLDLGCTGVFAFILSVSNDIFYLFVYILAAYYNAVQFVFSINLHILFT